MSADFLESSEDTCPNCGHFTDGDSICPNCGAVLKSNDEFSDFDGDDGMADDDF